MHDIRATATDAAGNTSPISAALAITVDTTVLTAPSAPDLEANSDTGSSNTDNITSDTTPTFTGTAEADSEVTLNSSVDGMIGTATADALGNWSITTSGLTGGMHDIRATATDAAGNTSPASAALGVTVDITVPTAPAAPDLVAASDTGSSSTDNITDDTTPTFMGIAEAHSTVEVFLDGSLLGTTIADGIGNWSLDYTGVSLSDGTYEVTATVTDAAGNTSATSAILNFIVDTTTSTAPTIDSLSEDPAAVDNDTPLIITGTAAVDSLVEVLLNGTVIGTTTTDESGTWAFNYSNTPLPKGDYVLTATITDAAGNIATSDDFSFTVVNAVPTTADTSVTLDEDTVYRFSSSDFPFGDSDGDPLQGLRITQLPASGQLFSDADNDDTPEDGEAIVLNQQLTVSDIDSLKFMPSIDGNGVDYDSFRFEVSDGTDFSVSSTMTFDITPVNDAPSLTNAIADQAATVGTTFNFTMSADTFTDVDTGDSLTYTATLADDSSLPAWLNFDAATGSFTGPPKMVDMGNFSVKVTATDTSGATASDVFNVGVETASTALSLWFASQLSVKQFGFTNLINLDGAQASSDFFDERYYLSKYDDVAQAVNSGGLSSGYDHFVTLGQQEGRSPSPFYDYRFFDERYYLSQYGDVAQAVRDGGFTSGYHHFVTFGRKEGRNPIAYYDERFYLDNNADVKAAVEEGVFASGVEHFLLFGESEYRTPSNLFNASDYLLDNPDVQAAVDADLFSSGFDHFLSFGAIEGRLSYSLFQEDDYLATHVDVKNAVENGAFESGWQHFQLFGMAEGRQPSDLFDESAYLAANPDVASAVAAGTIGSGVEHFFRHGYSEGRPLS
jgi:hypothetical protein